MFPGGVFPDNPFTGAVIAVGATGAYSQGNLGYGLAGLVYTIEGYGYEATSGPAGAPPSSSPVSSRKSARVAASASRAAASVASTSSPVIVWTAPTRAVSRSARTC